MNALNAIASIPQWIIGIIAAGGFSIWLANYAQAARQDDVKMRLRSGFGMVFELLVIVLVIAYYITR